MKKSFRQIRKIIFRREKARKITALVKSFLRLLRRVMFRAVRFLVYFCICLWLKKVHNYSRLPKKGPAIIVSNHLSYYDWAILSAVYWNKYIVFIGKRDLLKRGFVGWLMKLNILIFIDPENPGFGYFRESLENLHNGRILVIYPEGTRSRNGKMLEPKTGFVKIAEKTGAPIIPVGMKGTFDILPPHKKIPRFKKCEMFVGEKIYISEQNPLFRDCFQLKNGKVRITPQGEKIAAFTIMKIITDMVGQDWDQSNDVKMDRT